MILHKCTLCKTLCTKIETKILVLVIGLSLKTMRNAGSEKKENLLSHGKKDETNGRDVMKNCTSPGIFHILLKMQLQRY